MNRAIDTVLKYVVIVAIIGTLFVPLITTGWLFFPYITGKAFLFRLLVQIAALAYIGLILRDKTYAPKKNILLWSIVGFVVVMGISNLTSVNPARSFWSNFERMEGYVTVLHLFVFWLISASVVRTKEMWAVIANISLAVSVAVGFGGFMDYKGEATTSAIRIAGSLGNSSYLGVYSLIHVFISTLLLTRLSKSKSFLEVPARYVAYIAVLIFNIIVLYNTGTRGSAVGLGAGIFITTLLLAIFEKKNTVLRKTAIGILALVVLSVGTLGFFKESTVVKNNDLLYRFSSLITTDISSVLQNQGRARTLLWEIAAKGVKEKPILGWGQDNFSYVFAKYYDPKMYDQEQWFDRTHNVFLDWLIAGGILGLISYLGIIAASLYVLWRKNPDMISETEWTILDKSVITGLFVAHFAHNMFVFDNLTSYILFFLLVAYIYNRATTPAIGQQKSEPSLIDSDSTWGVGMGLAVIVIGYVTYASVIIPYKACGTLIDALYAFSSQSKSTLNPLDKLEIFKKALSYKTFGQAEISERLAEISPSVVINNKEAEVITAYMQTMSDTYADVIKQNEGDPRAVMFYGLFLQRVGLFDESLKYIERAIEISPKKQSFQYQKGVSLMSLKKYDEAVTVFKQALDLEPTNREAKIYYGVTLMYAGKIQQGEQVFGDDLEILADSRVLQALDEMKRYDTIIDIAKRKIAAEPENAQYHVSLASAYLKAARSRDAITELRKAIELAPTFQQQGEYYIKEIEAGRNPAR